MTSTDDAKKISELEARIRELEAGLPVAFEEGYTSSFITDEKARERVWALSKTKALLDREAEAPTQGAVA